MVNASLPLIIAGAFMSTVAAFHPSRVSHLNFRSAAATPKTALSRSFQLGRASKPNDNADESRELTLGLVGTAASLIVLASEYKLKTTGEGFPEGPFGVIGLVEGLSYLSIIGFVGWSLFKKATTGSGLPAGPSGLLGAAEGLSFLASVVGLIVLYFQLTDYGFLDWYPFRVDF